MAAAHVDAARARRRLQKEAARLMDDPAPGGDAVPDNGNAFEWRANIQGPIGTAYEGGIFGARITLRKELQFRNQRKYCH